MPIPNYVPIDRSLPDPERAHLEAMWAMLEKRGPTVEDLAIQAALRAVVAHKSGATPGAALAVAEQDDPKVGKARKFFNTEATKAEFLAAIETLAKRLADSHKGELEPQFKTMAFTLERALALAAFATDGDGVIMRRTLELLNHQAARIDRLESIINRVSQQSSAQAKEVAALTRKVSK